MESSAEEIPSGLPVPALVLAYFAAAAGEGGLGGGLLDDEDRYEF